MKSNEQDFLCRITNEGKPEIKSKYYKDFIKYNRGKSFIVNFNPVDKCPNWKQYKYLFGYLGRMMVAEGYFSDMNEFHDWVGITYNAETFKYKDFRTNEIITGIKPGSLSMQNINRKKLIQIINAVDQVCLTLGCRVKSLDRWIDEKDYENF